MTAIMSDQDARRVALGIAASAACFLCFTAADTSIKYISGDYAALQSLFVNSFFAYAPILAFLWLTGDLSDWRPKYPVMTALRGLFVTGSAACVVTAVSLMPLDEAYPLVFATPLIITALAGPVLGEKVGWHRWGAVIAGFAGVLIIVRPGYGDLGLGHGLALMAAVCFACGALILRRIGDEHTAPLLIILLITTHLVALPFALVDWQPITWPALGVMAISGIAAGFAQIFLVLAYRLAPAVVVAPFQYTQLLWGVLFGLLLFGDVPRWITLAGASLVIVSGLYILFRETRRAERQIS